MTMPHSSSIPLLAALLGLAGVLGCDQYPLHDLGYTTGAPPGSSDESGAPLPPVAEHASDFVGVWVGAADDPLALQSNADDAPPLFRFPSGSPRIRLELSVADGARLPFPSGTLTFGDAPPPPLATDPDVGYPVEPDVSLPAQFSDDSLRPPVEGFAYTATDVGVPRDVAALDDEDFYEEGLSIDGKIELSFDPAEVFESWCALQTAETCTPDQMSVDEAGNCTYGKALIPTDCLKASQCSSAVCTCSGDLPCTSSAEQSANLTVRFSDDGLVGLFDGVFLNERGFQQPLGTVHFRRETP
jgi:hypothetical protein